MQDVELERVVVPTGQPALPAALLRPRPRDAQGRGRVLLPARGGRGNLACGNGRPRRGHVLPTAADHSKPGQELAEQSGSESVSAGYHRISFYLLLLIISCDKQLSMS